MDRHEIATLLGISVRMVDKLRLRGMPIDSVESANSWRNSNLNTIITKRGRIDGNTGVKNAGIREQPEQITIEDMHADIRKLQQLDLETTDAYELFNNARALKEKALALQAAAAHEKFIGVLVEKADVEKVVFERGRQFRDGLMGLSRRLAPELVGQTDIPAIEKMLDKEFRHTLVGFAKLPVIE